MVDNSLRQRRTERGVSQVVLAAAVGVSRQTIHAVETSRYVPSVELSLKIAQFFGRTVEEIFSLRKDTP